MKQLFIASFLLFTTSAIAQEAPLNGKLLLTLTDTSNQPIAGATVMIQEDWSDLKSRTGAGKDPTLRSRIRQGTADSAASDRNGNLSVPFLTIFAPRQVGPTRTTILILERTKKLGAILDVSPNDLDVPKPVTLQPLVFVHGTLAAPDMAAEGHVMNRTVTRVSMSQGRPPIAECISDQGRFGFLLPAGTYLLWVGGSAVDGATYQSMTQVIDVDANRPDEDLGEFDLGASATTQLIGKAAPPLDGLIEWRNGTPLTIEQLRGKVVILDFWSYTCSICMEAMPDLIHVQQQYARNPDVVIIAVHDRISPTLDDAYAKSLAARRKLWGATEFPFRVALDDGRMFHAYGISGIPATLMIGRDGVVARRFYHAGVPGFNEEIDHLLTGGKSPPIAVIPPAATSATTSQSASAGDNSPKSAIKAYFEAIMAGDAQSAEAYAFCDDSATHAIDATIAERAAEQQWIAAIRQKFGDPAARKLDVDVDSILLKELDRLPVQLHGDTADIGSRGEYPCRLINNRWRYDLIQLHQNDTPDYFVFDEQSTNIHRQFADEIAAGRWTNLQAMLRAHTAALPKKPPAAAPTTSPASSRPTELFSYPDAARLH